MSSPMFLDAEPGMGIWTKHQTDDGKTFYFNMKRNESRWESEFSVDSLQPLNADSKVTKTMSDLINNQDIQGNQLADSLEQIALEAARKEREKQLEAMKREKSKTEKKNPKVDAYKKKVEEYSM